MNLYAGRTYINIYISPLSKICLLDSEEFQVFFSSVTKHFHFQEQTNNWVMNTYQIFYNLEFSFMSRISICARYTQGTHQQSHPTQFPFLSQDRILCPVENSTQLSKTCPQIRNVFFLMLQDTSHYGINFLCSCLMCYFYETFKF